VFLRLEEDGVLTDCSLKTLEPDEVLDFDFCNTNVVNKIIMKVTILSKIFFVNVIFFFYVTKSNAENKADLKRSLVISRKIIILAHEAYP
jgi:hypothetical protein